MKKKHNFSDLEDARMPLIFIDEDLNGVFSNESARKNFTALCGPTGINNYIDDIESAKSAIAAGRILRMHCTKPNGYVLICLFPFKDNGEKLALVSAQSSFSLYDATDGFKAEKMEAVEFQRIMQTSIDQIRITADALSLRLGGINDTEPYLSLIQKNIEKLNRLSESILDSERVQRLFASLGTEVIDIHRVLWEINKASGHLDLSELDNTNGCIIYKKLEFSSIVNEISDFLLTDSDGTLFVNVKMRSTDAFIELFFTTPAAGRELPKDEWELKHKRGLRFGLWNAAQLAEAHGGELRFEKENNIFRVTLRLRKLISSDYSGYIASRMEPPEHFFDL